MSDIPLHGGHATIHDRVEATNAPHGGDAVPLKPSRHGSAGPEPLAAAQVVDRLRWWRTRRVREQPMPVDHVVLRGSYANYSPFGVRPLSPAVARMLQRAQSVQAQYQRAMQLRDAPSQRRQASSLLSSSTNAGASLRLVCVDLPDAEARRSPPLRESAGEEEGEEQREKDLLDNKRTAGPATADIAPASPPPPPSPLGPPHRLNAVDIVCPAGAEAALTDGAAGDAAATPATPAQVPTEAEAKAAERLLTLYRPRAASAPLRPRHHRVVSGQSGESSVQRAHQGEGDGAVEMHHGAVTQVSTSDEITDVCRAPGAAASVVVLHHAPRLVLYDKGLNPKAALRAARVSADALESLSDAAAESSVELFAMTNLPLSGYERFFYQQQLRGPADAAAAAAHRQRVAGTSLRSSPAPVDVDAATEDDGASLDGARAATPPAATPELASSPAEEGVGQVEELLFFGAPLTATPACSPCVAASPSMASAAAAAAAAAAARGVRQGFGSPLTAGAALPLSRRNAHRSRRDTRTSLRAVSQPVLPRVYRGGCPQMLSTRARHHSRARPTQASPSAVSSSSVLPAGLRTRTVPQDGAHLCLRVDDLQDVYVFNPVVDVIGKGAFSKVYAAVPILRGRDGLERFAAPMPEAGASAAATSGSGLSDSASGRPASLARRASPMRRSPASPTPPPPVPHAPVSSEAAGEPAAHGHGHEGAITGSTGDRAVKQRQRSSSPAAALRYVPVVALKVIPRKARQQPSPKPSPLARPGAQAGTAAPPGTSAPTGGTAATSPQTAAAADAAAAAAPAATPEDNSVRRELVEIEREVSILRRLRHTGCAQFYEALRTPDAFVIAMRVFPGSMDARHYLSRYGAPSEARTALMLFQLVSTVQYLHTTFGLIHRDIKLENVLLSEANADVPDARIREVLGGGIHKSQSAALVGDEGDRAVSPADGARTAAQLGSSTLRHHVTRLLRTTLIDFGLARRTRASPAAGAGGGSIAASASSSTTTAAARVRGSAGRNASPSTSMTSPSHVAALATVTSSSNAVLSPHQPPPPPFPPVLPPQGTNSGSSGVSPGAQTSFNWAAAAAALSASGGAALSNSGSGSGTGPAPAPRPPLLMRRSPSTAGGGGGLAARLGAGMARSVSRVGMPSPMPSTANMFTRFLEIEEDMEEEEANGGAGGADVSTTTTACTAAPPGLGSRGDLIANDGVDDADSGASSTDVSASETDSDSESVSGDSAGDAEATAPCATPEAEVEEKARSEGEAAPPLGPPRPPRRDGCPTCLSTSVLTATPAPALMPQPRAALTPALAPLPPTPGRTAAATPDRPGAPHQSLNASCSGPSAGMRPRSTSYAHFSHQPAPAATPDDTEATLLLTPCGTEKYLPPEVLSWVLEHGWVRRSTTVGLARAMDLYAIGIVAYVLLSGCFPFNASSRATLLQQQQRVPRCNSARWSGVSSAAIAFVQRLLEPTPQKRMTAREALEHPFLQEARQLAEKLSLVPHGEGEEVAATAPSPQPPGSHSSCRDASHVDCQTDDAAAAAPYPRPHWAVGNTAGGAVLRAAPSPTHLDRARIGASTATAAAASAAAGERPSTHPNTLAALVPPVMGSAPVNGGGGRAFVHRVDNGHSTRRFSDALRSGSSGRHGRREDDEDHDDVLSSVTRDMLGGLSLPRRQPATPPVSTASAATPSAAPVGACTASSWPTVSAAPTYLTATPPSPQPPPPPEEQQQQQLALAKPLAVQRSDAAVPTADRPTAPRPAPAPVREERGAGGADDLFESLYNNIMSSD